MLDKYMPTVLALWFLGAVGGVFIGACDGKKLPQFFARALLWPLFLLIFILKGILLALAEDLGLRKK